MLARQFSAEKILGQMEFIFDGGNWSSSFKSTPGKKYGTMLQMLQYPFSKGSIHIPAKTGVEPITARDKPVINPRYYEGDGSIDFEIMKLGQEFGERICKTQPLADIVISRAFPPPQERNERIGIEEDKPADEWDEFVRNCTITDWHRELSLWLFECKSEANISDYSCWNLFDGRYWCGRGWSRRRETAGIWSGRLASGGCQYNASTYQCSYPSYCICHC